MKNENRFHFFNIFLLWCSRLIRSSIRDKNRYIFKGVKYSVFWSVRVQTKSIFFASKFIKNTKIRIQKKRYRSDQNAPTPRKYWHSESTKKASVFWRLLMMVDNTYRSGEHLIQTAQTQCDYANTMRWGLFFLGDCQKSC